MLPSLPFLRTRLDVMLHEKAKQGHDVAGLPSELAALPASYDAYHAFAEKLASLPMKAGWQYVEPHALEDIWNECDPKRPLGPITVLSKEDRRARIKEAFLGAVAGCILGKPLEFNPTLAQIRSAAESLGEWPINDYVRTDMLDIMKGKHGSWTDTTRGNISYVTADDDINYDIIGMLAIEQHGAAFTHINLMDLWLLNLPPRWTWGPERGLLLTAGREWGEGRMKTDTSYDPFDAWTAVWNPGEELCGAAIRVDAYGYACAGNPARAAELAWRDATLTHRRTGVYGAMFVAAAIAAAFAKPKDPLDIFRTAIQFIPQKSRFYSVLADSLEMVRTADDWLTGYERINAKYSMHAHCQVYMECATLMNSAKFARSTDHGFCMQVAMGMDTDCFGEIIGSILGAYFGPGYLDPKWIAPFNDDLRTSLGNFHERSLSAVAERMAALPECIEQR